MFTKRMHHLQIFITPEQAAQNSILNILSLIEMNSLQCTLTPIFLELRQATIGLPLRLPQSWVGPRVSAMATATGTLSPVGAMSAASGDKLFNYLVI